MGLNRTRHCRIAIGPASPRMGRAALSPSLLFLPLCADRAPGQKPIDGFTLIELIVVVLLLTILLGFAIPAFQAQPLTGSPESSARKLSAVVEKLKTEALHGQRVLTLHLDLDRNRLWVSRAQDETEDEPGGDPLQEWLMDGATRITRVRLAGDREVRSGTVAIGFYPQGYSDRAIIRLAANGRTPTVLVIEAFLPTPFITYGDDPPAF